LEGVVLLLGAFWRILSIDRILSISVYIDKDCPLSMVLTVLKAYSVSLWR
jgi:hypothetical protein